MPKKLLVSVFLLTILLLGCSQQVKNPLNWELKEFIFTNQENQEFGLADLKGKIWVADFVFTNCATVCLPMMANMTELQEKLHEENLDVELVSFSVDPEIDTPEVLKEYALSYGADLTSWNLLTGYSQEIIEQFALENFKTIARKPADDTQVIHGTSFYLINEDGIVIKDYNGLNVPYEEMIKDIKLLFKE
ncbi:SCO family protein [Metasolibacillus fluoroglycofenilyticus]|uniref:SCO family protein n=1 Tax=Metasolibacillus fluoroglycofenilyticus TaxID=1239396 RepID=UPI001F45ED5B|nr:SCO family protein [Metasolibacillus fluoroglycofenilyticus]